MIRTPRCRLSAIKYLDRRIPKDLKTAAKLIEEGRGAIVSSYSLVIRQGKASLEDANSRPGGYVPEWLTYEQGMRD